jgi:hypothetical protein
MGEGEEVSAMLGWLSAVMAAVALAGLCVLIVGWGVKQIWMWKEPMSTPAKLMPEPAEPPAWTKA